MKRLQNLRRCRLLNLGLVEYGEAWRFQKELFHARSRDEIVDTLILLQHPPTYTFGRRSQPEQPILDEAHTNHRLIKDDENPPISPFFKGGLKFPPSEKGGKGGFEGFSGEEDAKKVYLYWVDRGGGATYHGPGQLIGYPILALRSYTSDYHTYLRMLEEVIIGTLADFGIESQRLNGYTGVWVKGEDEEDDEEENPLSLRERERLALSEVEGVRVGLFSGKRKIASIGVRIVRGVTMHGFALNVNNDLEPFDRITPCNIRGVRMTSMLKILGGALNISEVEKRLIRNFALICGVYFEMIPQSVQISIVKEIRKVP